MTDSFTPCSLVTAPTQPGNFGRRHCLCHFRLLGDRDAAVVEAPGLRALRMEHPLAELAAAALRADFEVLDCGSGAFRVRLGGNSPEAVLAACTQAGFPPHATAICYPRVDEQVGRSSG